VSSSDPNSPDDQPSRISVDPELEAALREAEAAVDSAQRRRDAPEAAAGAEAEVAAPAAIAELEAKLAEQRDQLVRLQADFDNFRKRALRERSEASQYGHQALVLDLLSVVDNLERAIGHTRSAAEAGSAAPGAGFGALYEGVELVRRQLVGALEKHGVTPIDALSQPFDPQVHEAMAQLPRADVPPGTVLEVFQPGYRLRERVIRPARVMVSRAPDA
jgi:molecular chaperone GrpE